MQNKEFIFILFPPGFGGNHVKNLLGLYSNLYKPNDIMSVYNQTDLTAHASGANLQKHGIIADIKKYTNKVLLCGHLGEYLFLDKFLSQLHNRKFIIFNWTNADVEKLAPRLLELQQYFYKFNYFVEEQKQFYQLENVTKLLCCTSDAVSILNFSDLLTEQIADVLNNLASKTKLETNYNADLCNTLHKSWLIKNKLMAP